MLNKIYKVGMFDTAFEAFDRTFNYYNYGFLWVIPDFASDGLSWTYRLRNLRPFEFDMVFDIDTGEPWAFAICYSDYLKEGGVSTRFSVWTAEIYFDFECFGTSIIDGNKKPMAYQMDEGSVRVQNEMQNFLNMLPGAYLQNDTIPGFPVRNNLIDRSIAWNVGLTDIKTAVAVQGVGIPTIKHDQDIEVKDEVTLGKSKLLKLPQPKDKDQPATEFGIL